MKKGKLLYFAAKGEAVYRAYCQPVCKTYGLSPTEINFVKEISAKAHGDGYMSFSSNFWLDFVTVWGVIRLNLEPTQKADCISRIFIPKIDFPAVLFSHLVNEVSP